MFSFLLVIRSSGAVNNQHFTISTQKGRIASMWFGKSHLLIKALLCSLVIFTIVGCKQKKSPLPDHLGGQIYQGKMRLDIKCHGCHGWVGEGSAQAPALVKLGKTIPYNRFYAAVVFGRFGGMPAYERILKEKEIRQIIDWLEKISLIGVAP